MKQDEYDKEFGEIIKLCFIGYFITSVQFVGVLLCYISYPNFREITKWLFAFPIVAFTISFIVFAYLLLKLELRN